MSHHNEYDENGRLMVMSTLARSGLKKGLAVVVLIVMVAGPVRFAWGLFTSWLTGS